MPITDVPLVLTTPSLPSKSNCRLAERKTLIHPKYSDEWNKETKQRFLRNGKWLSWFWVGRVKDNFQWPSLWSTYIHDTPTYLSIFISEMLKIKGKAENSMEFYALWVLGVCEAIELAQTMEGWEGLGPCCWKCKRNLKRGLAIFNTCTISDLYFIFTDNFWFVF